MIEVAHVEAGLRSFDLTMPEEINRIVTDSISDLFFVTEESGIKNLIREGKAKDNIYFVGNVMIDNLLYQLKKLKEESVQRFSTFNLKKSKNGYVFLTLHRPSNVDNRMCFGEIADALNHIAEEKAIFFPVHPRTQRSVDKFCIDFSDNIFFLPPLDFKESLFLWKDAEVVMTDSGGLQEETTAMGVPCVTLRNSTERPVTVELGTNVLGGTKGDSILRAYRDSVEKRRKTTCVVPKWDGRAAHRIWEVLCERL